ncbi:uncharacterized protein LOC135845164 [Planococcus citri]|uniref:uncharacterized protein LOC135845164 n=1 Tax=Planococcus citri TaxID=170843 RepID=UPI0031F7E7AA
MIKSPAWVAISTYVILSITAVEINLAGNPSDANDLDEYFSKPEPLTVSLSCLLFKDLGCDIECFIVSAAYNRLGAGICNKDNFCSCNFALDPSLQGLWEEKFAPSTTTILTKIATNPDVAHKVHATLLIPFRTGLQSKEDLKQYLAEEEYGQLQVTDKSPASKMNHVVNHLNLGKMKKYVNDKLKAVLESSDEEKLLSTDYGTSLVNALHDARDQSNERFEQLVLDVHLVGDESLNNIVTTYLTDNSLKNPLAEGNPVNNDDVTIADTIAYYVIHELLKRTKPTAMTWFKQKLAYFISCLRPSDTPVHQRDDEVHDPDRFKVPSTFNRKPYQKSGSIDLTWKDDTFLLRYHKGKKGDITLNWVKKSVQVSILKTIWNDVNQNWVFENARINISRIRDGNLGQTWDLGTYKLYKITDPAGNPVWNWSKGQVEEDSLTTYKNYIETWCNENRFLIEESACIIYK